MELQQQINQAADFIKAKISALPTVGLILGSGLGDYADKIENPTIINYSDVPNFPISSVQGHASRFVIGKLGNKNVIAMQGRFHFYEGYSQTQITLPVRVMKLLGVETIIITNAAGGSNRSFKNGTLMLIRDHINFSGTNPLIGPNLDEFGARFPDMSNVYDKALREKIKEKTKQTNPELREGIYMMFSGPVYETPAEVVLSQILGADAVGMSTVPEAIVANHCGIKTIGISCITNMAAGITGEALHHSEVMETANRVKGEFTQLLDTIINQVL